MTTRRNLLVAAGAGLIAAAAPVRGPIPTRSYEMTGLRPPMLQSFRIIHAPSGDLVEELVFRSKEARIATFSSMLLSEDGTRIRYVSLLEDDWAVARYCAGYPSPDHFYAEALLISDEPVTWCEPKHVYDPRPEWVRWHAQSKAILLENRQLARDLFA